MAIKKRDQQQDYENFSQVNQQPQVFDKKKIHGNVIDLRQSQNVKKEENSTKKQTEVIKPKTPHNSK